MSEFAKEIISVNIEDELKQSYLSYALSVIHGRALPDIRDGLKPVHRRVLYGMHEGGHTSEKKFSKFIYSFLAFIFSSNLTYSS